MRRPLAFGLVAFLAGYGVFVLLDCLSPFPMAGLQRYGESPQVFARDGTPMRVGLTGRGERIQPLPLDEISPHLVRALIAQEDRRFLEHDGVDGRAILRAVLANLTGRRQGASTISMQLARLADPRPRTAAGKLIQAFRALQLESMHPKRFVLERYLNLVPFGGNLRGIGAAAHAWFGKRARDLTAPEAALLVSVLPSPTRYRPDRDRGRALKRRNRLLEAMGEPTHAPLGLRPTAFPDLAAHAWQRAGTGNTSIDPALQGAVEELARRAGGVDGLAIVLVENESRAVRALVGAKRATPKVLDATRRPRSAGSTLKPFLYALAFDQGIAAPRTLLLDLPWTSRDWAPSNFDRKVRGPVPAGEALAKSYNLPAIRLAAALQNGAFSNRLRRVGFRYVRRAGPAIDLAIGTDDITATQLAAAYCALANGGAWQPLRLTQARGGSARLCSKGAADLVTRILADPHRARPAGAAPRRVAWKTGTSSRRRDAWAAGYTRRYTAVVWRGRLDGKPHSSLVGASAAVPLLFDVLQAADPEPAPFAEPAGVRALETCPDSGLRRGEACPKTARDVVPAYANLRACDIHHRLAVKGRWLQCANCRDGIEERVFTIHGPALAAWRAKAGLPVETLPPHDPKCDNPREPDATRPFLLAPRPHQELQGDTIVVRALATRPSDRLTVLLDGGVAGVATSGVPFALPVPPGRHAITVLDSRGRQATAAIAVSPVGKTP